MGAFVGFAVVVLTFAPASIPTVKLNNGLEMPRLAISLPKTFPETAQNIQRAFDAGITHFVTANDYLNQRAIAQGLAELGVPRSKFFVTTMTSPCQCNQPHPHCQRNITDLNACAALTKREVLSDLAQLNLTHVDLILLHGPNEAAGYVGGCSAEACAANRAQWQAFTELYRAGKARAIGVSNYCPSCFECLLAFEDSPGAPKTVIPAVNQVEYHVAYGRDPHGFLSYFRDKGIVAQIYSPLARGVLATNPQCEAIGRAHNRSAAQVAMRWVFQNPVAHTALLTHSTSAQYLHEDAGAVGSDWALSEEDMRALDAVDCDTNPELCTYYGNGSTRLGWGCTE